jgi:tetratricopeptide (TPR) repeat protein
VVVRASDSSCRTVIHVWAQPPFLSLGISSADLRDRAFCAEASRELLVLYHFLRRLAGRGRLYRRGGDPDLGLLRGVFQGFGRRSRIQKVETDILDNSSPANYEELGELYKDQKQYEKARAAFTNAITARSDSIYTFYSRALCSLGLNDLAGAIPDLERVVTADRKFDYYRAAGLLADAYARTGQLERADALFAEVTQISTTPETLYNYASFLKTVNRPDEAREWVQKLQAKKRTLPRYMQRRERPWFRKGKSLLKELASA